MKTVFGNQVVKKFCQLLLNRMYNGTSTLVNVKLARKILWYRWCTKKIVSSRKKIVIFYWNLPFFYIVTIKRVTLWHYLTGKWLKVKKSITVPTAILCHIWARTKWNFYFSFLCWIHGHLTIKFHKSMDNQVFN